MISIIFYYPFLEFIVSDDIVKLRKTSQCTNYLYTCSILSSEWNSLLEEHGSKVILVVMLSQHSDIWSEGGISFLFKYIRHFYLNYRCSVIGKTLLNVLLRDNTIYGIVPFLWTFWKEVGDEIMSWNLKRVLQGMSSFALL